ncbi:hypothetical protein [Microbacterium sp.]|uniref:hypothetical protein n=1 Tax=Microbacterium sp. TaxID=51671 RepID=UPI0032422413
MPTRSQEQDVVARRRLRKFLARSERALNGPVTELRSTHGDGRELQIHLTYGPNVSTRQMEVLEVDFPSLDPRILDSVVVDCRVFFTMTEDCYLPSVVASLRHLAGHERSRLLRDLTTHVEQVVRQGRLVAPVSYGGRLEMDNGIGRPGLLGDDQIAMDYIYGMALHEDEERIARLRNVPNLDIIRRAVLLQMDQLLRVVADVRAQVLHDVQMGYVSLASPETSES